MWTVKEKAYWVYLFKMSHEWCYKIWVPLGIFYFVERRKKVWRRLPCSNDTILWKLTVVKTWKPDLAEIWILYYSQINSLQIITYSPLVVSKNKHNGKTGHLHGRFIWWTGGPIQWKLRLWRWLFSYLAEKLVVYVINHWLLFDQWAILDSIKKQTISLFLLVWIFTGPYFCRRDISFLPESEL